MELQQLIVYVIVLLCFVQAARRTLRYFRKIGCKGHPCEGCASGCPFQAACAKPQGCCQKTQKKQKKQEKTFAELK